MTLTPLERNRLEMALRNNGYHIEHEMDGGWLAADATAAPGRCFLAYLPSEKTRVLVATSLAHAARAFSEEGGLADTTSPLPAGAAAAFVTDVATLPATVRRIFELAHSLPAAPLRRFEQQIQSLPRRTEAERLVVERIGQEVFREALMDFWLKQCAVTGLDQPELLRASHMKPWAHCPNDEERLNPFNGLLLAAHWDAAFDRGLVTFDDDGTAMFSTKLSENARNLLVPDPASPPRINLRADHLPFLSYHRQHVWQPLSAALDIESGQ